MTQTHTHSLAKTLSINPTIELKLR
ncbi:hypothetical protein AYI68_g3687, partial [Smittium mucronatum]